MKTLCITLIMLIITPIYGEDKLEAPKPKITKWSYVFYKYGSSIFKSKNTKATLQSHSAGYKRIAHSLIYGMNYGTLTNSNITVTNVSMTVGYTPDWRLPIKPMIEFGFGRSSIKLNNLNSSGFSNSLDIGFQIRRVLPFHVFGGMKIDRYNYKDINVDSASSQEFYIIFAYEF